MAQITIDVPDDVIAKLAQIAENQSTWSPPKIQVDIEDLIQNVLSDYARAGISERGKMIPDLRNERSPFVRLTNSFLAHAIDFGILDFQIPPADDLPSDTLLKAMQPQYLQDAARRFSFEIVQRLAVMATPITGTIPIAHGDDRYSIFVEFDKTADNQHRVHVKITQFNSSE